HYARFPWSLSTFPITPSACISLTPQRDLLKGSAYPIIRSRTGTTLPVFPISTALLASASWSPEPGTGPVGLLKVPHERCGNAGSLRLGLAMQLSFSGEFFWSQPAPEWVHVCLFSLHIEDRL